ncbi:MAG: cell division protein FtsH [Pirellulaceae bacterium]
MEDASPSNAVLQLRATAYHEAGHAVMAVALGRSVQKVTVTPGQLQTGGVRLGACAMKKGRRKASDDPLEDEVLILMAGMVAESHFTGQYCQRGATQDLLHVRRLLETRAKNEKQLERLRRRMLDKTEYYLAEAAHAQAITWIAEELIAKQSISGRAVEHFFNQAVSAAK